MIGFLKGEVMLRDGPHLIVDVNGVGYRVFAVQSIHSKLNGQRPKVELFTYTHVRDDALELFGFPSFGDLKLFKLLIGVSGIGPKTAIGIFAIGSGEEIKEAIAKGDVAFFSTVPRLGRKNAQKIIIELRSKIGSIAGEVDLSEQDHTVYQTVIEALRTFGFNSKEASDALRAIRGKGETVEEKVRLALKDLGK